MTPSAAPRHPGEILRSDFLDRYGVSQTSFAQHIGVTLQTVNRLIAGRGRVTARLARKLAMATDTSPMRWMEHQAVFTLWELGNNDHIDRHPDIPNAVARSQGSHQGNTQRPSTDNP